MTGRPRFSILVVDENPAVRLFVELAVGSEAVLVLGATDGHAARVSVEDARPDLVLAASEMAGSRGPALASLLSSRRVPVVLMTGGLDRNSTNAGSDVGVLTKPLQLHQLRELVARTMSGESDVPAAAEVQAASEVRAAAEDCLAAVVPSASDAGDAPGVQAAEPIDPIEAWMRDADSTFGVVPSQWRLTAEDQALHPFVRDVSALRAQPFRERLQIRLASAR